MPALWLQEIDATIYRNHNAGRPEATQEALSGAPAVNEPEALSGQPNGHSSHQRLYRLGLVNDNGTVQPVSDPLPQWEAFELMERNTGSKTVLIPVDGEGVPE